MGRRPRVERGRDPGGALMWYVDPDGSTVHNVIVARVPPDRPGADFIRRVDTGETIDVTRLAARLFAVHPDDNVNCWREPDGTIAYRPGPVGPTVYFRPPVSR